MTTRSRSAGPSSSRETPFRSGRRKSVPALAYRHISQRPSAVNRARSHDVEHGSIVYRPTPFVLQVEREHTLLYLSFRGER